MGIEKDNQAHGAAGVATTEHGSTPPDLNPAGNVHSTVEEDDKPGEMPPPLPV